MRLQTDLTPNFCCELGFFEKCVLLILRLICSISNANRAIMWHHVNRISTNLPLRPKNARLSAEAQTELKLSTAEAPQKHTLKSSDK